MRTMQRIHVRLFAQFSLACGDECVAIEASKARELLAYLLLHRARGHPRETLATVLWPDAPAAQAKKYLRQALWHVQSALARCAPADYAAIIRADGETIHLTATPLLWLDAEAFEQAYAQTHTIPAHRLDDAQVRAMQGAADLYCGDLLADWYHDWCLAERERFQNMYLLLLDKLMERCEVADDPARGLDYGARILHADRASERTHRRMMRLHARAGDRTAALRQYDRCALALAEELAVAPSRQTEALRDDIRADRLGSPDIARAPLPATGTTAIARLAHVLGELAQLESALRDLRQQVRHKIELLEHTLDQ